MDFPEHQTPPARRPWALAPAALGVLALAIYAVVLARNAGAVAAGSDSSGYMNHARLIASGSLHVRPRAIPGLPAASMPPMLYVPLGFRPAANGDGMVPTYPSGLPLFVLALEPVAGWRHAGDAAIILHSLAGLLATYFLCRTLGLGRPWSALGAAIIGLSPLYLFMSVQAMSDVPSLAWTTLAVIASLRSRERAAWALLAGAAMAIDVLLRPTNVLAFAPVAVALGASPRRWSLLVVGGLPGAIFFFAHSLAAYGSLAATGYGDTFFAFRAAFVPPTLLHYARWLPALFTPLVALNLGLPWAGLASPRTRWLLAAWILAYAAFFSAYQSTHETWWYLRFLLPAAPALAAGALLVLRTLLSRAGAGPRGTAAGLACAAAVAVACSSWFTWTLSPLAIGKTEMRYEVLADWLENNVPLDAVCLTKQASGALYYYTQFTFIRWDVVDKANAGRIESAIQESKRPLYAVLFPLEFNDAHVPDAVMPGHWTKMGTVGDVLILRRDFGAAAP
jgi:hypothetical protein